MKPSDRAAEWLEADGLGGFASGAVQGPRTRRYHALLLAATTPPTGRYVLVNGCDAHVETAAGRYALTAQRYAPDVVSPDGESRLAGFSPEPWPTWTFALEDGAVVEHELFVPKGLPLVVLSWRLRGEPRPATLTVRPFLSGRDYHALHHENGDLRFEGEVRGDTVTWRTYASVPSVTALANGGYFHEPHWYRSFVYSEERARGLDHVEDLAAPGSFRFDLERGEAVLVLAAEGEAARGLLESASAGAVASAYRASEKRRRARFGSRLERSADAYLVRRGEGRTIVAGYPWFTDWGRDTFIALRGLCLATGRMDEARSILVEWAGAVSEGMLPNRFPDRPEEAPEFNAVDASLWYVVAVGEYLQAIEAAGAGLAASDRAALRAAALAILEGYAAGTRHGIRADSDGLLAAGEPGVQLTWMDARVGAWVVTPRIGKPVEIQALWANALAVGAAFDSKWKAVLDRARAAFAQRFWNAERQALYDVVDVDHRQGAVDPTFRPNQIFAVGGLPLPLLSGDRARAVVDAVEAELATPLGLRSLEPRAAGYASRYEGGVRERDGVYHQGTVWPWLVGAFVEAWVRVRGGTRGAKAAARERFIAPLLAHLDEAGIGHVSEIADADAPHTPRGCPFQAWSVGEVLRLEHGVLAEAE
ncbi:MAG TPA: amylo-alpha-1,6-glucosidase [Vicinamibacteria bacterium]|nr:amylo-alpha-1,6-glucosidase [Vicinamibacteria bacterium]